MILYISYEEVRALRQGARNFLREEPLVVVARAGLDEEGLPGASTRGGKQTQDRWREEDQRGRPLP